MKTLTRFVLMVALLLMLGLVVQAQDNTSETAPTPVTTAIPGNASGTTTSTPVDDTVNSIVLIVLAVLLSGSQVYGAYITRFLARLVPPETAQSLYESGVRFGYQTALNRAALTPSADDDEYYIKEARARGLEVVTLPAGGYQVKIPPRTTPANLPTSGASSAYPTSGA